jgi:uncharacterized protein
MHRAYCTLDIKADNADGKRTFRGIASTPTTDRGGDIVEPLGAQFELPLPFLWQHNAREPIGWITEVKAGPKEIAVAGEVAVIDAPGKLKDRVDEAWDSLRSKLVRGLSIGFKEIEAARIADTYSYRYLKWLWLELSAVTIPMNGDCSITAIKSADEAIRRAASGAHGGRRIVRLDTTPVVTGSETTSRRKGAVYLN